MSSSGPAAGVCKIWDAEPLYAYTSQRIDDAVKEAKTERQGNAAPSAAADAPFAVVLRNPAAAVVRLRADSLTVASEVEDAVVECVAKDALAFLQPPRRIVSVSIVPAECESSHSGCSLCPLIHSSYVRPSYFPDKAEVERAAAADAATRGAEPTVEQFNAACERRMYMGYDVVYGVGCPTSSPARLAIFDAQRHGMPSPGPTTQRLRDAGADVVSEKDVVTFSLDMALPARMSHLPADFQQAAIKRIDAALVDALVQQPLTGITAPPRFLSTLRRKWREIGGSPSAPAPGASSNAATAAAAAALQAAEYVLDVVPHPSARVGGISGGCWSPPRAGDAGARGVSSSAHTEITLLSQWCRVDDGSDTGASVGVTAAPAPVFTAVRRLVLADLIVTPDVASRIAACFPNLQRLDVSGEWAPNAGRALALPNNLPDLISFSWRRAFMPELWAGDGYNEYPRQHEEVAALLRGRGPQLQFLSLFHAVPGTGNAGIHRFEQHELVRSVVAACGALPPTLKIAAPLDTDTLRRIATAPGANNVRVLQVGTVDGGLQDGLGALGGLSSNLDTLNVGTYISDWCNVRDDWAWPVLNLKKLVVRPQTPTEVEAGHVDLLENGVGMQQAAQSVNAIVRSLAAAPAAARANVEHIELHGPAAWVHPGAGNVLRFFASLPKLSTFVYTVVDLCRGSRTGVVYGSSAETAQRARATQSTVKQALARLLPARVRIVVHVEVHD